VGVAGYWRWCRGTAEVLEVCSRGREEFNGVDLVFGVLRLVFEFDLKKC